MKSNWGRVFYTNLWACLIAGAMTGATEPEVLYHFTWSFNSLVALAISCILGVGMSWAHLRRMFSGQLSVDDVED